MAGTGLAYVAGFGRMRSVLIHPHWVWLAVMAGALCLSFAGYYCAYRGTYQAHDGYRERPGWRDRTGMCLDSVLLVRQLFARPLRHPSALGGMVTFWAAEIFAVWAGLAAFGVEMGGAALTAGFCTGMVATRRVTPMGGAGLLTLFLTLAIWYCGAPFTVAIAGTFAYRALTLWLPMPFSLAALPALRQLGEQAVPGLSGEPGADVAAAA